MNNSTKMGLVKAVTLFLILLALSGMAAIVSADEVPSAPIMFYGTVTLNDANAFSGTAINAYIDGKLCGSVVTDTEGRYHRLDVIGNESDNGEEITFTVCGATAGTAVWHASTTPTQQELNLIAVDNVAPAVENADATPTSIVANGTDTTQLSVTVTDGCRCTVGDVTIDLSAIGGDAAQAMTCTGDTDVYAVPVTVAEGTAPGAYCLYVNASDVFENYNAGVCIDLVIKDIEAPVVTNPDANPASIVADGTQESRLNVTVVDDSDIDFVTVDLSAIGGSDVQTMTRVGDTDVYSVTVNATEGTSADTYCLQVNASDVFGNYDDTSVCIGLEIVETTALIGDINGDCKVDYRDLGILGATYGLSLGDSGYNAAADLNGDNMVNYRDLGMLGAHYGEVC